MSKVFGAIGLISCLAIVYFFEGSVSGLSGAFRVFHWPAMVLTGLGPFALVMLCAGWSSFAFTFKILRAKSPHKIQEQMEVEAKILDKLGRNYYKQGKQALDTKNENISPAAQNVIRRLNLRLPISDILNLIEKEREREEMNFGRSLRVLGLGLRLAPSIGMLGTILGMVQLLASLQDPTHIGAHMSLALLTTFYGLFFSLIFWTPLQFRVEAVSETSMAAYEQLIHWLELLEGRKPAQYFAESIESSENVTQVRKQQPDQIEKIKGQSRYQQPQERA